MRPSPNDPCISYEADASPVGAHAAADVRVLAALVAALGYESSANLGENTTSLTSD